MKRKAAVGILLMSGGIFLSSKALAQASPVFVETGSSIVNPGFFVAILAGVLIAFGFQLVLTNLSVATGFSIAGDIRKKIYSKNRKSEKVQTERERSNEKKESEIPLGVKLFSGAGAWAMITGVISLFFASFFAVKLSLIDHNGVGVALGLAIWAVFSIGMFYLESRGVGSLINSIFSTAISAVKVLFTGAGSVVSGTGSFLKKSEADQMESVADHTIDRLGKKLEHAAEESDMVKNLSDYVSRLNPQSIDMDKIKDEFADLLNDIKVIQRNGNLPGERELILNVAGRESRFSKEDVGAIDKLLDIGKSTLQVVGAVAGTGGLASVVSTYFKKGKNIDVSKVKHEAEDYVMKHEPLVNQDIVRDELNEIFSHESMEKIKAHEIDKEYVAAIVAERKGYDREDALHAADSVEEALNNILRESNITEVAGSKINEVKDNLLQQAEDRIRNFFNKIERPELNYDLLKSEFEFILNHPNQTPEVLRRKLKQLNKDSLIAVLTANSKLSQSDVQNISNKFEEARANVLNKIGSSGEVVREKAAQAKEMAVEQAEKTRKTAAAASWWLLATFILTGLASALGGMMAL